MTILRKLLLNNHPARVLAEALVLGSLLLYGFSKFGINLPDPEYVGSAMSIVLFCVMVFSLRLPIPNGSNWRKILFEILAGLSASLLIAWLLFHFFLLLTPQAVEERISSGALSWVYAGNAMPLLVSLTSIALRFLKHAGRFWEQIRRKHLIWELTHGHLMLVIMAVLLLVAGTFAAISLVESGSSIANLLTRLIGFLAIGIWPFIILVLVILLPSSILSYFTSKRITRRLQTLTEAFDELKVGNFKPPIQVSGEDEVAQLQLNFNTMASDLESAISELQTERDAVTALLKSRRELFAGVSHDLRTPVATLRAYIESTLEQKSSSIPLSVQKDLEIMSGEVIHLQRLIDDIFTVARSELDRLDFKLETTEIIPLLHRIVERFSPIAWQKGKIQLVSELPPQIPTIKVDNIRLEQIVNNLLQNAIRHTPPGGIIVISAKVEEDTVIIQIKDSGEGIKHEDINLIWDPYFRSADSHAKRGNGFGLGLMIVKEMTEAMGGIVAVESQIGEGSCFTIRFPVVDY